MGPGGLSLNRSVMWCVLSARCSSQLARSLLLSEFCWPVSLRDTHFLACSSEVVEFMSTQWFLMPPNHPVNVCGIYGEVHCHSSISHWRLLLFRFSLARGLSALLSLSISSCFSRFSLLFLHFLFYWPRICLVLVFPLPTWGYWEAGAGGRRQWEEQSPHLATAPTGLPSLGCRNFSFPFPLPVKE